MFESRFITKLGLAIFAYNPRITTSNLEEITPVFFCSEDENNKFILLTLKRRKKKNCQSPFQFSDFRTLFIKISITPDKL